jgi:transposase
VITEKRVTSEECAMVVGTKKSPEIIAEEVMIQVKERERIRRAYYVEGKSMRQIERELHHGYWTIRKALDGAASLPYRLREPRAAPVLGPYRARIEQLLAENANLPRKQRYTSHRIYKVICEDGYRGSESGVRRYVGQWRRQTKRPEIFIPLEFDPGMDAQVDWGEAWVEMAGEKRQVELFVMRLCYSRKLFAMAFPTQRQESFFTAHVKAFHYLGGVPHRLVYDNLKTAVRRVLEGRNRQQQEAFIGLRSHYLFESRFCTPGKGHEKGGVENGVGYVRRNFLVPMPKVADFFELNRHLQSACDDEDQRQVDRQPACIGAAWQAEKPHLRPLPAVDYPCCISREVILNPYGQVVFDTNRYSVPVELARKDLVLKAYPFHIEILADNQHIATHRRCYERKQDILDPLHYLPLLAQRPGAFEHAKPLRQWQESWPPAYETLRAALREQHASESRATREFVQVLQLHQTHPTEQVNQAIEQALAEEIPHLAGVTFCLNRLLDPTPTLLPLDLSMRPELEGIGRQPLSLNGYNRLLEGGTS